MKVQKRTRLISLGGVRKASWGWGDIRLAPGTRSTNAHECCFPLHTLGS
jgi:hypothetical protein